LRRFLELRMPTKPDLPRRAALAAPALLAVALLRPAQADPLAERLEATLRAHLGGATARPGRVRLEIPPLVENGNTVPVTITVDSPMTEADHVTEIALFNERNPQVDVIVARLSPANGVAQLATRIRLATSQRLVAVARMKDGTAWSETVGVVVTLAACVEG
jgi:sulfur-oxidizing protein SoxY